MAAALLPSLLVAGCSSSKPSSAKGFDASVRSTWTQFFNAKTSVAQRVSLLEDGQNFASTLDAEARGGDIATTVKSVSLTDPTHANVSFSLTIKPNISLPSVAGAAVFSDGGWKVSKSTMCAVLAATATQSTACS